MRAGLIVNFLAIDVGWLLCVTGPKWGLPWIGPAFVTGHLVAHHFLNKPNRAERILIAAIGLVGFFIDSLLSVAGLLSFPYTIVAPVWLVALWVNLATGVNQSLSLLGKKPWVGALFGAIGGPLAYLGGAKIGDISLSDPMWHSMAALSVVWAIVFPGFFWLKDLLEKKIGPS
jgi:hypothetical protein